MTPKELAIYRKMKKRGDFEKYEIEKLETVSEDIVEAKVERQYVVAEVEKLKGETKKLKAFKELNDYIKRYITKSDDYINDLERLIGTISEADEDKDKKIMMILKLQSQLQTTIGKLIELAKGGFFTPEIEIGGKQSFVICVEGDNE